MGKTTYQNKSVEVVRPAKQGDKDFNASAGEQVIVRLQDGTEKTVPKAEVTEATA
jgi:ribosomal protein L14